MTPKILLTKMMTMAVWNLTTETTVSPYHFVVFVNDGLNCLLAGNKGNSKFTRFNGRKINNKYLKNNRLSGRNVNKGADSAPMSCDN